MNESRSAQPEVREPEVFFARPGDTMTDVRLDDRTIASVITERREWWEEYVEDAKAHGDTPQTWSDVLRTWLVTVEEEIRLANAWRASLSLALKMVREDVDDAQ